MTLPVAEDAFELACPQPGCVPRTPKRGRLIRDLSCPVSYPDGTPGTCRYTRFGPAYHGLDYDYGSGPGRRLAHLYSCQRWDNDAAFIEAKCREMAEQAFWRAVEQERKDFFARATLPEWTRRTVSPTGFQMCLRRARALGGRYALCVRVGTRFVPADGPVYDTLKDACEAWRKGDRNLCVCCCSRLDRNWQLPALNPLVLDGHPRRPA